MKALLPLTLAWWLTAAVAAQPADPPAPPPLPVTAPAAPAAPALPAAQVEFFSPTGYVKQVRQVTVRFTVPMVALGDPRLPDPFTLQCPAKGQGRWADDRNWVYDFDADLEAGIRCRFSLKSGLKSAAGAPVTGHVSYSFHTGGPAIVASLPHEGWQQIDEDQIFLLRLDAPAEQASIETHAYCAIDGVDERIPLQVLTGKPRQDVLDRRQALGYDYLALLWKSGARTSLRARNRALEERDATISVARCQRQLPPGSKVALHWDAGIKTVSGLATHEDQQLAFHVRPAFTAQVECTRSNPRAGCIPLQPIQVNFSVPVPRALALAIRLHAADGAQFAPDTQADTQVPTLEGVSFIGPFPEDSKLTVVLPEGLVDDAGRALSNAPRFPLSLRVDAFPPLIRFNGTFGILEAAEGGVLPVTLRNVEPSLNAHRADMSAKLLRTETSPAAIASWLDRVEDANNSSGEWRAPDPEDQAAGLKTKLADQDDDGDAAGSEPQRVWHETTGSRSLFHDGDATSAFTIAKPLGRKPEEVIGIPLQQPGFYVIEIASPVLGSALLGHDQTRYVATAALVTDLAVHFKWGRESSLVWVTRLSDGKSVTDARVSITDLCTGGSLWHGRTDPDGLAAVPQSLGTPPQFGVARKFCPLQPLLMVTAVKGNDFSFTESNWSQGITPYEFSLPVGSIQQTTIYHTLLDRALYRAGETVSMKHFVRQHVSSGLSVPSGGAGKHEIDIVHQGSGQRYTLTVQADSNGIADNSWTIPVEAKLGEYSVSIDQHPSAQFKVEQFRLPSMHASVVGPAKPLVAPQQVDLDLHVAYLSGGGAGGIPVKLRTLFEPRPDHFTGYEDYSFGGAPVHEGISSGDNGPADVDFESEPEQQTTRTRTVPLTLDAMGSARVTIDHLPTVDGPGRLTAELEYADANGEMLTTTGYVRLVPASVALGIRRESWIGSPGQMRFRVIALDLEGKPLTGQAINVSLYQSNAYSYRKRLIGGFYSYETTRETKKLDPHCTGTTNAQGLLLCDLTPGASGQILLRAETLDPHGTSVGATASMWVYDANNWWFGGTQGDRMELLPEKKEYEPGETARFQVRMPFQVATALVTVEREGVLSHFVTTLHGNAPIIEVPIAPTYAPNVYVSVLALRGRVAHAEAGLVKAGESEITALVDLTKPAYRLGDAQIKVGWRAHRLDVTVAPGRSNYKVRDQALIRVHVATADGRPLPAGSEIALAAVDEALLDLAPNDSWNLLQAMMGERGLEVFTSTAQMQVIGKRHYGRKAIAHGGGGGRELDRAREMFDSLLFWQPRIVLDAQGDAAVTVPLNDSLSSFRIVAVATGGAQLFGTGTATINTTQDLILLSGLPPLVREGDRYSATFTLRNTTDHALTAQLQAVSPQLKDLPAQTAAIPAGQSRDLIWPVTAPVGASRIDWDVTAHDTNSSARDHLRVSESLIAAVPVRTYQATITQLKSPWSLPTQRPRGAIEGRGGLQITLQAKLADSLEGVREYMQRYPYTCLEQLASRAVAERSRPDWDALMARLPAYMDSDGLLKYFPTDRLQGDDSLTAYMLSIAQQSGWPLNDTDQARVIQALTRFVAGKLRRNSALPTADLAIRKLQAIDALSRYGAARSEMLDSVTLEPNLMPTSALLDWVGVLQRTPDIPLAEKKLQRAFGLLRARLNFQGTTMGFATERSDALWWLMISTDSNANRLLLAVLDRPDWREDIPRLVRGSLGRQQFGHWNTTVANAWGVLALDKFSAAFESVPVSGETAVRYGPEQRKLPWPAPTPTPTPTPTPADASVIDLPWQAGPGTLQITHEGSGAPWAMVRAQAALPLEHALSTGFKVARTLTAVEQQRAGVWTRGDVLRIHLELEAQSDMSWVVVDDPVPAGATILGSGLNDQSDLLRRDDRSSGWAWLAFEERRFEGYRGYFRFVPKGHWTVEYTVRLNNPGTFQLPATRVEAMYAPEMFGELPNPALTVQPAGAP